MKMIDKFNWGAALLMVLVTVFVTGKVDLIAFLWLPYTHVRNVGSQRKAMRSTLWKVVDGC